MSLLTPLRSLYALDVLDARFVNKDTSPPVDPAKPATVAANKNERGKVAAEAPPPLWNTIEFYAYVFVVSLAVPSMIYSIWNISQPSSPTYRTYEHLLSPGWIPGRKVDNSDGQYSGFRDNIPYMLVLLVVHPLLRRLFNKIVPASAIPVPGLSSDAIAAGARYEQGITFDRLFGVIYLVALNGASAFKVLLILYVNYSIAHRLPRSYVPYATWVFNIAILFANELLHGYPYEAIARVLLPAGSGEGENNWGSILDSYGGIMPRWEVLFKITILRMISYNMDFYWSPKADSTSITAVGVEKKQLDPAALSERERVSISAAPASYNFRTYLAYILYSPLYLAGPILTFNDYVSQRHYSLPHLTWSRVVLYGVRFLVCVLCMEFIMHFLYAVAISKATSDWSVYSPVQLGMIGYWNLTHIWLKLLIPWRFFRLWALADGVDPPENMIRCMSDNYSAMAFWRGWHRSLNRWIVRYIYIPLNKVGTSSSKGLLGVARSLFNFLAVFTFMAVWHDINLQLLAWGWMIVLFITPEILATLAFPAKKWQDRPTVFRVLCGIGGALNVLGMMAANLVGFAVGLDGLKDLVDGIIGSYTGIAYLLLALGVLYTGVQVMFEHRQDEWRQGIRLRS